MNIGHSSNDGWRLTRVAPTNPPNDISLELAYRYFGVSANSSDGTVRNAFITMRQQILLITVLANAQAEMDRCNRHYEVILKVRNLFA